MANTEQGSIVYHSDYDGVLVDRNDWSTPLKYITKQGLQIQSGALRALEYLNNQPDVRLGQVRTVRPALLERARQLFRREGNGITMDQMRESGIITYLNAIVHTPSGTSEVMKVTGWETKGEGKHHRKVRQTLYDSAMHDDDGRPLPVQGSFRLDPAVRHVVLIDDNRKILDAAADLIGEPGMALLFAGFTFAHFNTNAPTLRDTHMSGVHVVVFNQWNQIQTVHERVRVRSSARQR